MPSFTEAVGQVPLCTLSVATLCIGLQGCVFFYEIPLENFTLVAANVIYLGEYYRIISAALLHVGLMHIAFNMMSFLSIGSNLEATMGTLGLAFTILWSIILAGSIHVGAEWAMTAWITKDLQYVHQPAVGFSGVIFTLAVMESYISTQPTRSVFGMIQVPTRMYPWVLLVVLSVIMPGISFMGHLSGILVGVMHVYGVTKAVIPSPASIVEMENSSFVQGGIGRRRNFVPSSQPLPSARDDGQILSGNLCRRSCGAPLAAFAALRQTVAALINRALGGVRSREGNSRSGDAEEDADARGVLLTHQT